MSPHHTYYVTSSYILCHIIRLVQTKTHSLCDDVTYAYDDVTYAYDDVTYAYDDVTYAYDDVTYAWRRIRLVQTKTHSFSLFLFFPFFFSGGGQNFSAARDCGR